MSTRMQIVRELSDNWTEQLAAELMVERRVLVVADMPAGRVVRERLIPETGRQIIIYAMSPDTWRAAVRMAYERSGYIPDSKVWDVQHVGPMGGEVRIPVMTAPPNAVSMAEPSAEDGCWPFEWSIRL